MSSLRISLRELWTVSAPKSARLGEGGQTWSPKKTVGAVVKHRC